MAFNLILFPGLGADGRMFLPQRDLPASTEIVEWQDPESQDESLRHYAQRIAQQIGPRPDAYVGGVSLGAVLALEVADAVEARGVLMIGGCRSHRQIARLFRLILWLGGRMPKAMIGPALALGPLSLRVLEGLNDCQIALMMRMLREHPPAQTRWSCRALLGWEGCPTLPQSPLYAIHGSADEVIPPQNVHAAQFVHGGRHLISLTHPREVTAFLLRQLVEAGPFISCPGTKMSGVCEGSRFAPR